MDASKVSKRGRLKLSLCTDGSFETVEQWHPPHDHVAVDDLLETVFENGTLLKEYTFDEIRGRAKL